MATLKYENIWELLNKFNFEIDYVKLTDLLCIICKKIIRNPRQSLCGCRYCYECIKTYLNDEDKRCPGATNDCKEHVINLQNDVHPDHVANMKVSRIIVTCPDIGCEFTDELRNMADHINSHQVKCPYLEIGCDKSDLNSLSIGDHLLEDALIHSTLMIDSVQHLKNELTLVREQSKKATSTNDSMQQQIDKMQSANASHTDLTQQLLKDVSNCEHSNVALTKDFEKLKNEFETLKKNQQTKEVAAVNKLTQRLNKMEAEHRKSMTEMRNNLEKLQVRLDNVEKSPPPNPPPKPDISSPPSSTHQNRHQPETMSSPRPNPTTFPSLPTDLATPPMHLSPFIWTIHNFSDKRKSGDSFVLSDPFFSHEGGYKLCLTAFPGGCAATNFQQLSVGFHLMRGPHDSLLPWPMPRTVAIALVDQQSRLAAEITCNRYRYDTSAPKEKRCFHRPTAGMNEARKSMNFFSLDQLTNGSSHNGRLYRNDAVMLLCVVE